MMLFKRASQSSSAARRSFGSAWLRFATSAFIRRKTCTLVAPQKQISSKAEEKEIVPGGKWNHQSEFAVAVPMPSDLQAALAEAKQ